MLAYGHWFTNSFVSKWASLKFSKQERSIIRFGCLLHALQTISASNRRQKGGWIVTGEIKSTIALSLQEIMEI